MIICLVCGEQSPAPSSHCPKCGANLPKLDYSSSSNRTQGKMTGRYNLFAEAAVKTKEGAWTRDEFADWLQGIQNTLSEKAAYLVNLIHESGYYDYQMDEVEMCLTGIEHYEKGIEEMWMFVQEGEEALLDRGLELIWEGNEMINEAMRLNREFRRSLEEEWGYM